MKLHAHPMSRKDYTAAIVKSQEVHLQDRYTNNWISPVVRRNLANSEAKYYLWHGVTR